MPERYHSDDVDVAPLGKPLNFEFSKRQAKNRFMKAAMTERLSSWDPKDSSKRGVPSPQLINVYRRWGEGGFGVILTGNLMIDYDHIEAPGNPIIPQDAGFSGARFEAFKKMGTEAKKHGSLVVGQVSHPGRQVVDAVQKDPISASDVQLEGVIMGMTFAKPHAASQQEIDHIINGFAHSAEYLYKAGYDGIELHGAHGYLLSQFLSPTTNRRTDKYGGSLENRARLIIEIAQAIRKRVPDDFIVGIKINSVEFQDKGFDPEECREMCTRLEQNKFDFIELSGGTYEQIAFGHKRESTKKREAFFLEFADIITPALKHTRTFVTGGLKSAGAMVNALNSVDGVGLARPVCQEFHLPADILSGKVKAAIDQKTDDNDFGLTNVCAGSQIKQVGSDHEPIDLSNQDNLNAFLADIQNWQKDMSEDTEGKMYGYLEPSSKPLPYVGVVETA